MSKVADAEGEPSHAPTTAASAPVADGPTPVETAGYGEAHPQEVEVYYLVHTLAGQCEAHAEKLKPFVNSYGEQKPEEPE